MAKVGILRFPGTNCDRDTWQAIEESGGQPKWLWHKDRFEPKDYESYIVPGGFSYGDYLRSGALAAHSPVMSSLKEAADNGAPVFGICNGFQILCEAGLLPGVLMQNLNCRFIDKPVELEIKNTHGRFSKGLVQGQTVRIPIAHADGRYFTDKESLKAIEDNEQVFCTYKENPNGSVGDIAGVMNKTKNVLGMMPHPERALFDWSGSIDGKGFFQ